MRRSSLVTLALLSATPALAQDASRIQPSSYRVVSENATRRVLEFRSRPGMGVCGSGLHSHPAHLTILLTPADVRERRNGRAMIVHQKTGDRFFSPPVTHETENIGGGEIRALIVEYKKPPR